MTDETTRKPGRMWRRWIMFGVPLGGATAAFVAGIVFWGGFNTAMEATNTKQFCISCHEMRDTVFIEYEHTIHHENRSGVQATCSDCHVPDPWIHKMVRKVKASKELLGWATGKINTPEKFEAHRLSMAQNVWTTMKETDSRECRNCHTLESMNPRFQAPRARQQHLTAMETGQTCIDCHKGIAHKDVRGLLPEDELEALEAPRSEHVKEVPSSFLEGLAYIEKVEAEEAARAAEAERAGEEAIEARIAAAVERATSEAKGTADGTTADGPGTEIDWSAVDVTRVGLFYPGQAAWEWVLNGKTHGGARAFTRGGDTCSVCHAKETAAMGAKIVSGETAETTPIPGKRGSVELDVQAAHDDQTLYLRLRWKDAPHVPVPFIEGGRMDTENPVKMAMMVMGEGVEHGEQAGCWASCHMDSRTMPNAPEDTGDLDARLGGHGYVQKYIPESRTEIELRGRNRPLGGWDLLEEEDALAAFLENGTFMDLTRVDASGTARRGYLLERRHEDAGHPVEAGATLEGDTWTMVISRPLAATGPGQVAIEPGRIYTVGFALHDDHSAARFHHVSLDLRLALDDPSVELNAVRP